ncbi:Snurportin-1-like [Homarus americanus]|uniref:Snurportin-1 n=1 Tax=Homarus americanus TaxID=6706 RepID=A0A8J5MUU9_HOMAM|nr:Snurportin-1-like [Homarus americanus]
MDDLLSSLSGVAVTAHPNNPHAEHPRFALYKAKSSGSSQHERRRKILEARREARYDLIMHLRCIEEENAESSEFSDDNMECEQERRCYFRPKKYHNFLMLSEWLVDVPEDFASSYFALPCPVGKRSLVVSARGRTRAYAKSGVKVTQFPSLLPGGNRHTYNKGYALLDCIWSETNKTYYILDLIVWLNQSIMECETMFRFEWLKSRMLEEIPEAAQVSRLNPYRFEHVPYYDCSPETLRSLIHEPLPFSVPLDGVLFYHKESHYTHGPTPLVGWLKAYMFPEILDDSCVIKLMMEVSSSKNKNTKKTKNKEMEVSLENQMESSATELIDGC